MKKQVLLRTLFGLVTGIAIWQLVVIAISAVKGDGTFHAAIPEMIGRWNTEFNAVLVQTALVGLLGAVLGAASMIWENERWSLTKQTALHFAVFAVPFHLAAYCLSWIPRSAGGVLVSAAVFAVVYSIIWCCIYFHSRYEIGQINDRLTRRGK